jgi:serine/threonine protein kinase
MGQNFREGEYIRDYQVIRPPWVNESELDHAMSRGLMATSYMARSPKGEKVFLKTYSCPTALDSWQEGYEAYQRELKRIVDSSDELQSLTYRFVEFFLGRLGASDLKTYVQVFEFVEGGTDLRKFLNEDTVYSVDKRTTFAQLMMYAMSKFHEAGIVHCDLKPENMMLFPSDCKMGWNLRVVDFDWAVLDGKKAPWIDVPDGMGYATTPGYSSPEWCDGQRPTSASDVFTCGLILYELLTRDGNPYGGLEDDRDGYKARVKSFAAPSPVLITSHGADADAALQKTIRSCLDPNPANRPSAGDMHKALLAWSRGEVIGEKKSSGSNLKLTSVDTGRSLDPLVLKTDFGARLAVLFVSADDAKFFGSRLFTLVPEEGTWHVVPDESAVNATLLNGRQIVGKTALHEGDELAVGSRKNSSVVKSRIKVSFC